MDVVNIDYLIMREVKKAQNSIKSKNHKIWVTEAQDK